MKLDKEDDEATVLCPRQEAKHWMSVFWKQSIIPGPSALRSEEVEKTLTLEWLFHFREPLYLGQECHHSKKPTIWI